MYKPHQLAFKYLHYLLSADNGKGHGIHSPFVYRLVSDVFNDRSTIPPAASIEAIRRSLLQDERMISVDDFGAGSVTGMQKQRSVKQIAASSLKPKKYAQLLYRLVSYLQPSHLLEMGTSLGITTAYLASAVKEGSVTTMEGAESVAAIAASNFRQLQLQNINLVTGPFEVQLASVLRQQQQVDFAFVDGNHRYEPTMQYFRQLLRHCHESSVIIFDDIHWSPEMEKAWKEIQTHPAITLSIDLFFIGIIFFRREQLVKQHFTIRF